jgi:hypothetical protein
MKQETPALISFKAPELVGKVAPEIKPAKYTSNDLEKYPGLKELFPPHRYSNKPWGSLFSTSEP